MDGQSLGVMPLKAAQELAYQNDLDLVEISPNQVPAVCAIMDYGKFKFDQKKKMKEQQQKQKNQKGKEIKLRPVTSDHDVSIKIAQLKKFLEEKRPVSVFVEFKKRELLFRENGKQIIDRIVEAVQDVSRVEQLPRFEGKKLHVRFLPK